MNADRDLEQLNRDNKQIPNSASANVYGEEMTKIMSLIIICFIGILANVQALGQQTSERVVIIAQAENISGTAEKVREIANAQVDTRSNYEKEKYSSALTNALLIFIVFCALFFAYKHFEDNIPEFIDDFINDVKFSFKKRVKVGDVFDAKLILFRDDCAIFKMKDRVHGCLPVIESNQQLEKGQIVRVKVKLTRDPSRKNQILLTLE